MASASPPMRQVAFFWRQGGADVRLTGSFCGWSEAGLPMERESSTLFSLQLQLPVHSVQRYKFIVDGAWRVDEKMPLMVDAMGNQNNELLVAELFASSPARAIHGEGDAVSGSAVGTPGYARDEHEDSSVPVGSVMLSAVPALDPNSTSYIGAGVLREYTEEYELDAHRYGAQKRALARSSSMSQLDRLSFQPSLRRVGGGEAGLLTGTVGLPSGLLSSHHRSSFSAPTAAAGGAAEGGSLMLSLEGQAAHSAGSAGAAAAGEASPRAGAGGKDALTPLHLPLHPQPASAAGSTASSASALSPSTADRGAGSSAGSSAAHTPREGAEGSAEALGPGPTLAAPPGPARVQRPKLPLAMNRAVGVPTSVPVGGEAFGFELSRSLGGGSGGGGDAGAAAAAASAAAAPSASAASPAALAPPSTSPQNASPWPLLPSASSPPTPPQAPLSHVQALLRVEGKLVVAMVGLPARGKTYIARHLKRHLGWMGYRTEIFNVGNYRRKHLGARQSHDFFDPLNKEGEAQRHHVAEMAFNEMAAYFRKDEVDVAIFDATNTTVERRQWLIAALSAVDPTCRLVFVEPICNDESIIRSNVVETKLKSPDYKGMDEATAVADFLARIQHYVSVYQPLGECPVEENVPYIKLIDLGKQFVCNRVTGYLNSRVMFFLFNLHVTSRPIWLTRHGESEFNVQGRIGGDSGLSLRGAAYAQRLGAFFNKHYPVGGDKELVIWTSTLRRTQLTSAHLGRKIVAWKALDEIDAGVCDGMTYEAIAAKWPEEYAQRARAKFTYRYPRGESYADIVLRLEPLMVELVRQRTPVLIISHQATLRVLYAYLTDMNPSQCPEVLVPLHTVLQLTPKAYSAEEVRHELLPPNADGTGHK